MQADSSGSIFIQGIVLGFLFGVLANWVFAIILRLLPDVWVRYGVQIERLQELEDDPHFPQWWALVKIAPPFWLKRIFLKEPLSEYLVVRLKLDNGKWTGTKWEGGDINHSRFRADGAGTINALAFTISRPIIYLCDFIDGANAIKDGQHTLQVRVVRLLDNEKAAEKRFSLTVEKERLNVDDS